MCYVVIFCLDFVNNVPQGLVFSWLPGFIVGDNAVFLSGTKLGTFNIYMLLCGRMSLAKRVVYFLQSPSMTGFSMRMFPTKQSFLLGTFN